SASVRVAIFPGSTTSRPRACSTPSMKASWNRSTSFNWKARTRATRRRAKGVTHGRFQFLAYPDPRDHPAALVRRQPFFLDDGRRRQRPEKLQTGDGG